MSSRATTMHAQPNRPARSAADIMIPISRTCAPTSTVAEAAQLLRAAYRGVVPVVEDGRPVGVLTDRDLALGLTSNPDLPSRPVAEIMSRDLATVSPVTQLGELRARLAVAPGSRLLVADTDGRVLGLIERSDLLRHAIGDEPGPATPRVADRDEDRYRPAAGASWRNPREFWHLLRDTFREWMRDKVPRLGAALAFYTVLSLAPLLLIAIALAGLAFGEEAAQGQILEQIRGLVGKEGAAAIQDMIATANKPRTGSLAALIGLATLLFAASGVFGQLQDAMNTIWEVQPKPGRGIWRAIKDRFLSFAMVLGTGFLLLVSLLLTAVVAVLIEFVGGVFPVLGGAALAGNLVVSFIVITLLFALIFKLLPDAEVAWRDVWVGSVLTTILFLLGKVALGMYLGRGSFGSTYGAAGSLVVLLLWIYYSAQIVFFGAEFTKVFADRFGSRIVPAPDAEPVTPEARAEQGMAPTKSAG